VSHGQQAIKFEDRIRRNNPATDLVPIKRP
jgi:hypothetical protein